MQLKYSKSEMKCLLKQHVKNRWQKQWEEDRTGRWVYSSQRVVTLSKYRVTGNNRPEETIFSMLRFGPNALSYLNRIGRHEARKCA